MGTRQAQPRWKEGGVRSLELQETYIGVCPHSSGMPCPVCMYMCAYHMYVCIHMPMCIYIFASMWIASQGVPGYPARSSTRNVCIFCQLRYANQRWGTPIGPKGMAWLNKNQGGGGGGNTGPANQSPGGGGGNFTMGAAMAAGGGAAGTPFPNVWGGGGGMVGGLAGLGIHVPPLAQIRLANGSSVSLGGGARALAPWQGRGQMETGFQLGMAMSSMQAQFDSMNRRLDTIAMCSDGRPTN